MKKMVIVGTGQRALNCFARPISEHYRDRINIVGVFDKNICRAKVFNTLGNLDTKVFENFDDMLSQVKPNIVLVTTMDSEHDDYVIRALKYGCDVICEKPMTTDEVKCDNIIKAHKQYGNKLNITFNCRFMPYLSKIKEIIDSKALGKVLTINYEYLLDRSHGADYFRRWHRSMRNSGGMLVHKSTHHLDVVNWWLNDDPVTVAAQASLSYFGANRPYSGTRCSECAHKTECEYYLDIKNDKFLNEMYQQNEHLDGYIRDNCVFGRDIDIYDNMSLNVKYKKGALLTYSLTMFNPYEGYKVSVTGDKARLEAVEYYTGMDTESNYEIKVYSNANEVQRYSFTKASGAHGGGDTRLRDMLFGVKTEDKLGQTASSYDGAKSIMIGICANKSIHENQTVNVENYLKSLK